MLEKYMHFKMFFDYQLPLILICISGGIYISLLIIGKIIETWDKRQKRLTDKFCNEEEGSDGKID